MKKIALTNCDEFALIDDSFAYLKNLSWYRNNGYAARMAPRIRGKRRIIYLHRVVAGVQDYHSGRKIKNRRVKILSANRLDNRRENLY